MRIFYIIFFILCCFEYGFSQNNEYPITGNVTINHYSPQIYLKRNTNDGGFIQGIQTQFSNGNNNWFFGNVHEDTWVVSKGDYTGPKFSIFSNGNVGIGTIYPSEKLEVNGKIRAKEIKVEVSGWPDYVFSSHYNLPPLAETEKFITEKGHLPGVPSAKTAENEGINIGEINKILLQKIEELTLHLIRIEKEVMLLKTDKVLNTKN